MSLSNRYWVSNLPQPDVQAVVQRTLDWLDRIVIGLNLCPFAASVRREGSVRLAVCESSDEATLAKDLLAELDLLQQTGEAEISTTLLVFPRAFHRFDSYWQFYELAENLLLEAGLEGVIQLASFHPDYCFEGEPAQDVSHFTNRSPYPMLHLIREQQLERVLAQYPDPEAIPDRNIATLRRLGESQLRALFADFRR